MSRVPRERWAILLLVLLSYPLFFHAVGKRYLWSPDEDEYTLVNREMVEDGHWIWPTVQGEPYGIKPPLYDWAGSAIAVVTGGEVNEFTSRLPSAIAALFGLIAVYLLGRVLFGPRAGFLAALVLGTTPLYIEFARWIQINMFSTVLHTLTMLCFAWGYFDGRRRRLAYLLMYVPAGLGVLNMGLVNLAMPAIAIFVFLLVARDLRHLLRLQIPWGVLIVLAIAAPWYVVVNTKPGYLEPQLASNFLRLRSEFGQHTRPFWYYLLKTPPYFLPWLLFLPAAFVVWRRETEGEERKRVLFLVAWVASIFVMFSIAATKRSEYMLPIYPALALLTGWVLDRGLDRTLESETWRRRLTWPLYGTAAALALAGVAAPIWARIREPELTGLSIAAAALLLVGGGLVAWATRRKEPARALAVVVAVAAVAVAGYADLGVAKLNDRMSARGFCLDVVPRIPEGTKLKMYRNRRPIYAWYTRRRTDHAGKPEKLDEWLAAPERIYVVIEEEDYKEARDSLTAKSWVVHRRWVDHRYMLLISNRPDPEDKGPEEKHE